MYGGHVQLGDGVGHQGRGGARPRTVLQGFERGIVEQFSTVAGGKMDYPDHMSS